MYLRGCYLHEADDGNHFYDGEDKLGFTIAFHAKHVDDYDDEEEYRDENGALEALVPV